MMSGNLLFFGTPEFAVPTLAALCDAGRTPVRVVTQPARPVGRGRKLTQPPVAEWAASRGLTVDQPERVRDRAFLERVAADEPWMAVVVAFGQIFPRSLLRLPSGGCVNLHASLLPTYRGAAPIQAAVAAGEERTGVSTMLMERGLDSGPVLLQEETPIGAEETSAKLAERLARLGAALMVETLERLERSEIEPREQDATAATYAPRLTKEDGRVDWWLTAAEIFARLRGYTPWPGLTTSLRGEPVKIGWGSPLVEAGVGARPGEFLGLRESRLAVACGEGTVFGIERLQRPGRRALAAAEFVNGEHLEPGELFA